MQPPPRKFLHEVRDAVRLKQHAYSTDQAICVTNEG